MEKKKRSSNFELLRIICMLLILVGHYSVHGGCDEFTVDTLSEGVVFIQMASMFARTACAIFILITGYFMIERKQERHHYRRIVPLIAELFFYSYALAAIFLLTGHPFSIEILIALVPFMGNWFVVYYILFYCLIPLINPILTSMKKKTYQILLFAVYIVWSVFATITFQVDQVDGGSAGGMWSSSCFDLFLVMYMTGAYIRLYVHGKERHRNTWNLVVALTAAALILLSVPIIDMIGVRLGSNLIIANADYFHGYNSVLSVIFAISLFLYFSNLNIQSKIINTVAGSVVGIYLIHDNRLTRGYIWRTFWPNADYFAAPYLHMVIKVIVVFLVCLMIDLLRRATIGKWFEHWFFEHCDAMLSWMKERLPSPVRRWITEDDAKPHGGGNLLPAPAYI